MHMSFTEEIRLIVVDEATPAVQSFAGSLRSLIGAVAGVAGVMGAGLGLGALVKQGIEFNKTMEDSKGGIAGVLLMTRQYVDQSGKVVAGQESMNAAFAEASVIQEKLKKDALGTAASYTELVGAFQTALAPAAAAGVTNLEDVREITVMATQAMAALNIPTVQAAQELRGLFSGDMGPDNRLNQVLRVSKADLKALGGDAEKTAAFFKDKLAPAASAAAMQTGTLTVRMSNLGDILDQVTGKATAGIFKDLSSGVAGMIEWIERIGPAVESMTAATWASVQALMGPLEEVGRITFSALDARVKQSGGTWTEVVQGFAIAFNNIMTHVRAGWAVVFNAMASPLDTLRLLFGNLLGNLLEMLAEVAQKLPDFLGGGSMAASLRSAAAAVDEWGLKENSFLGDLEESLKRTEEAHKRNEAAILNIGTATAAVAGGTKSNPKGLMDEASGAAVRFGQVWAAESAKATAALQKFVGGFASFTGDTVGAAIAKIEEEYRDLVGQLGQMMFMAKVPFEKGLAMLEQLAQEKGRKIVGAIFNGEAAVEDLISVFEAKLTRNDVFLGIKVAWAEAMEAIPGAAASAASAVQGVWQSMARSFDDLFYNVLSGRLDNLGDVFKNLWQSLLQTFSRFLTDMVQRWIKSQLEMRIAAYGGQQDDFMGPRQPGKSGGAGGAGILGYVGAAGAGYGIGGNIGAGGAGNQWGGAIGAVGGLALGSTAAAAGIVASIGAGAAAGSVAPIIGTIIGAIVGAIIGGLFNKSTEKSITGSIGGMAGATRYDTTPIYAKRDRETRGTEGEYGEPEIIGYETRASLERATTSFEREGQKVFQAQAATLADIFRVGGKGQASELLATYQATLKESLSGAWFKIRAGSDEDIEKDAGIILTRLLPRIGLSAAFGQTGYLPHGDRDGKGGIPGVNWGMPGMDAAGNWTGAKQLFDPEAPIPKMLAGLGFTNLAIEDLAKRIAIDDPAKLLAYIQGIVGFVAGVQELGAEMGKTFAELKAGWDEEADAGAAVGIGKRASELASLFDELSLYSGDEQLTKATEVQAASAEFWESVKSYLKELDTLAEKLSAGLQGMREKMRDFLNPLSEAGAGAADQATIDGVWGKLLTATDPAQIEAATNEAASAIEALFNVLAERVTRGAALVERLTTLGQNLGSIRGDALSDRLEQESPLAAMAQDMVDIQRKVSDAARLTGLEQIAAMEDVAGSAEEMYGKLRSLLSEIASVSESINKSIDSQIWELGVGELDASGQASAVTDRIRDLQDQLAIATSPAEIQAIVSEIQGLTTRYAGTFGQDDPNRAEAIAWAQEELERTRGLANEALAAMREQAQAYAEELKGLISGSVATISTNIDEASTAIGQLSHTLGELDRIVRESLERLGQDALDSLGPLREAMDGAAKIFTEATGAAALALSAPDTGLDASARRTASAFGDAEQAIRKFVATVNGFTGPGETPAQGQKASTSSYGRTSTAQIISTVRRHSGVLTPRVA